jgi:DNA-binding transcriptional LysR family regulator
MHLRKVDANLLVTLDALLVDASVTRAAERLGRSSSAISHALAKLREIFADELFVRAGQRLVPTAKALELAPTVHVILAGMESLLRPSKPFDPSETSRDFAVAASEAGELMLVQPLRQRLNRLAPSVKTTASRQQIRITVRTLLIALLFLAGARHLARQIGKLAAHPFMAFVAVIA